MVEKKRSKITGGAIILILLICFILMQLIFLSLRLMHTIDWQWVYVFMPSIVIGAIILAVVLFLILYISLIMPLIKRVMGD